MCYVDIKYTEDLYKRKEEIYTSVKQCGFPWKKYFILNKFELFDNIKKLPNLLTYKSFYRFGKLILKEPYEKFVKSFPHTFNGKYVYIRDDYNIYKSVNILTDLYTEEPRVKSIGHGQTKSHFQLWNENYKKFIDKLIAEKQDINAENLRELLYGIKSEARMGKISIPYSLYKIFKPKKILDTCMAWGDRLIAAIAFGAQYHGVEPNIDLRKGHHEIIKDFAGGCKTCYRLTYKPFEKVILTDKYDFAIVSPPPFVGETYSNSIGQSITSYTDFNTWFEKFMMKLVDNIYNCLIINGHMLITILDRPENNYAIVEKFLKEIIKRYNGFKFVGVISWETSKNSLVPYWIFKKLA